jgi:hypothetical protein
MNSIETSICDAIELIVDRAISQASYDKTIQATIVECTDSTIGKYKVKYQDSTFYAYSSGTDVSYTAGASVYILVPGNDMSKDKTILGTTKKLGINYVATVEGDEAYEIVGSNCISSTNKFSMSSYRKDAYTKVLYSKTYNSNQNLITLNKTAINEYIKTSNTIICGALFKTSLPVEQQYRGNYGIIFALDFIDNATNETVTRYYTIDVDKMTGNPYKLISETRQYGIFEIDNKNFKEINYISIFTYNFPNSKDENLCVDDIFVNDIELYGAEPLSEDDINNYSLTIATPQGKYFDDTSLDSEVRTLQAQVRVKGKVIDNDSQSLPFYWFIEHVGVTSNSQYYNKYGGQGWKCLNNFNVISAATATEDAIIEWIPASYNFTVKKSDVTAKEVKYKCAVVYDGTVITKTIIIKNLSSEYDVSIVSDVGTQFYFDIGYPTLQCLVGGKSPSGYSYSWAVVDNSGTFQSLAETPQENADYASTLNEYNILMSLIDSQQLMYEANKERINNLKNKLDEYEKITRVEGNTIYHLNVNTITNFSTYQCTVYFANLYIGTASITLTNKLEAEGAYSLIINDGAYVYKYNENGVSPASASLDSPIDIKALTFNLYDNLGNRIDDDVVKRCNIQWIVPSSNTMISIPSSYTPTSTDAENKTETYSNIMSLSYKISDRYDITKTRNNIQLLVNYQGMSLSAVTDFTFIKEGEPGTNGTEFTCKIVPNIASGATAPLYPTITQLTNKSWSINYTPVNSNKFFRAQLWHNENKILDSVSSANSTEGKKATIKWSILKNKYTSSISDTSALSVDESTGTFSFSGFTDTTPAHIAKVTIEYDDVVYYATMPIITVKLSNNNYRVNLKEYTGFRYATYTSDGQSPKYDNVNPFEILVTKYINNYYEDIGVLSSYGLTYTWSYLGRIYESSWVSSINLGNRSVSDTLAINQKAVKPLDSFDGQCVTNAVECIIKASGTEVARIHIPIHLMLNRYGNSALNGWDGNSINIDADGGFILAPQVGAGIKETDNSFTGVLMGKVKESGQTSADIGLFGYAKGTRSIFLDAETGKARFGANGKGQIIIDPESNKAQIYSGNYSTSNKTGMMIDLTTPEIRYGSGNFYTTSTGIVHAISAVIEGDITANTGYIGGKNGFVITTNKLYNGKISYSDSSNGIYIGTDGIALGSSNKFCVDKNGNLTAKSAVVEGEITAKKGNIGGFTITSNSLYNGKSAFSDANDGVYIGTNGIALGANNSFKVSSSGVITAVRIDGEAVNQINTIINNSKAMQTANEAINAAKSAAATAQSAANTAQNTANTANSAAATAKSAAETAQNTANGLATDVRNTYNSINTINGWINQLSGQLRNLGQPGIS